MSLRVLVIGLDCVPPSLLFDRYAAVMPVVRSLVERGLHGSLESTFPPITVPAWTSMFSGATPGEIGVYGFHCRERDSYASRLVQSDDVSHVKRVWDLLGEQGHSVASLFVPPSWPARPVRGEQVSCLMTPPETSGWAFPRELEDELTNHFGAYEADIPEFRHEERGKALRAIVSMGRQHFSIARHIASTRAPDFLSMVEVGPDRFHHLFWDRMDPSHPRYDATQGDPGAEYYAFLDSEIGALLQTVSAETHVIIASDHGAQTMHGGFHLNEWLRREGYLVLRTEAAATAWSLDHVDWSRTRAWGEGGYIGRIYLNACDREPSGIVPLSDARSLASEIARKLIDVRGPGGQRLQTHALAPSELYRTVRGSAPDLQIAIDALRYRCLASWTGGSLFSKENDRGPDACNHSPEGVFILAGPSIRPQRKRVSASILDVAPTILSMYGHDAARRMGGRDWSRG